MNDFQHDDATRQQFDQLDRLIDLGNAGRPLPAAADPELAALLATVGELRQLRSAPSDAGDGFATLLAARLSEELGNATSRRVFNEGAAPLATLPGHAERTDGAPPPPPVEPIPLARQWGSRRQWLQMAAAIVAFVAVGALLVALLRDGDSDGGQDGQRGGIAGVDSLPTADTSYRAFSNWDEALTFARTVAGYKVVAPWFAVLPARLDEVVVGPIGQDGVERDVYVIATWVTEDGATALEFTQGHPSCDDVGGDGGDPEIRAEIVDLGGRLVQRTIVPARSVGPFVLYDWESGGRCAIVRAHLSDRLTTEVADAFVAGVPLPGAAAAAPTPDDSGITQVTTWEQAAGLTPFSLVRPVPLPDALTLNSVILQREPDHSTSTASAWGPIVEVSATYRVDGALHGVQFGQHVRDCSPPEIANAETTSLQLGGRDVTRTQGTNADNEPIVHYQWLDAGVCRSVFAPIDDVVTIALLESLVAALPRSDAASPQPDGTPGVLEPTPVATTTPVAQPGAASDFPILTITPDYAACDASVTLRGWNFTPGTTVAIYGGGRLGDSFGPVANDASVNEDGSFETTTAVERIAGGCIDLVEREGQEYRIAAATGSTTTGVGDEPSASAVFTLGTTAPAQVVDRLPLPSCGVEEQFVDDGWRGPVGPKAEMRGCFASAVAEGRPAEFRSFQPLAEDANLVWVPYIYQTTGGGAVTVIEDRTHDGTATGGWTTSDCSGFTVNESGDFSFAACSDPVRIGDRLPAPPAPATAAPVLMLTPDYGTCDDTVAAWGWNFIPGSTIAIFGGPYPGDNFGALIDAMAVRDDGTFAIELPLEMLLGACDEALPTAEGAQFVVGAATGEADAKDGVIPDGPQAGTVWTYATTVPATIRKRAPLPSCGTERQMPVWDSTGEIIGPDRAVRECFFEAWTQRRVAEFVSHDLTNWPRAVTTIYRTNGDGVLWVYTNTRSDTSATAPWETQSCIRYVETGDDSVFTPTVCDPEPLGE